MYVKSEVLLIIVTGGSIFDGLELCVVTRILQGRLKGQATQARPLGLKILVERKAL
jgi:hypothetical protein